MKTITITKFEAMDGKQFGTKEECINYEVNINHQFTIESDSNTLSDSIFGDLECKDWDSQNWNCYLYSLKENLQKVYNMMSDENYEELKKFDYYELGDVIHFLELLRIKSE